MRQRAIAAEPQTDFGSLTDNEDGTWTFTCSEEQTATITINYGDGPESTGFYHHSAEMTVNVVPMLADAEVSGGNESGWDPFGNSWQKGNTNSPYSQRSRYSFNRADGGLEDPAASPGSAYMIFATHGALGGAPWVAGMARGHTEQNDKIGAVLADYFVRRDANKAGVPISPYRTITSLNDPNLQESLIKDYGYGKST